MLVLPSPTEPAILNRKRLVGARCLDIRYPGFPTSATITCLFARFREKSRVLPTGAGLANPMVHAKQVTLKNKI